MKILIPVEKNIISPRFSTAKEFVLLDILNNGEIKNREIIDVSSKGSFEKAKFVKEKKIQIVICSGIENWIYHYLTGFGIRVLPGINGMVDNVITNFISGALQFYPFPGYGFNIIPRGRFRRGRKGHGGYHNGHFKNRFL